MVVLELAEYARTIIIVDGRKALATARSGHSESGESSRPGLGDPRGVLDEQIGRDVVCMCARARC